MRKLALTLLLTALIINNSHSFAADPLRPTTPGVPSSIIMQAFYWDCWPLDPAMTWYDVIAEQAPAMKAAGITHFWFPPPTKGMGGINSMGYDLFDHFDIGQYYQKGTTRTRFGYKHELLHAAQVAGNVLLDLVPNHMMGGQAQLDFDGIWRYQLFDYPHDRFEKNVDHFFPCPIVGGDPFEPLVGEELNHAHPYVRDGLLEWATWLRDTVGNVSGFRIDGVKHFCWNMSRDLAAAVGPSIGEYWCSRHNILEYIAHTGNYAFDFPLYYAMDGPAGALDAAGLLSDKAVSFVANHDTDTIDQKIRAYGFIMYIEPIPCVFWLDWFNPYLQPAIKRAMAARNAHNFYGTYTKYVTTDLIIFGNDGGVFGVFNSGPDWDGGWVQLTPNATYYAIAWGGFDDSQPMPVTTDADGWVKLYAAGGGFAFYIIPEPATMILLGIGLSGLALWGKKKRG